MEVLVRVPTALRELVAGASSVVVHANREPVTVASVLDALAGEHPALERRVRDERGQARPHVNVFVGPDNIRALDGFATPVAGREVTILPAISGGATRL